MEPGKYKGNENENPLHFLGLVWIEENKMESFFDGKYDGNCITKIWISFSFTNLMENANPTYFTHVKFSIHFNFTRANLFQT